MGDHPWDEMSFTAPGLSLEPDALLKQTISLEHCIQKNESSRWRLSIETFTTSGENWYPHACSRTRLPYNCINMSCPD